MATYSRPNSNDFTLPGDYTKLDVHDLSPIQRRQQLHEVERALANSAVRRARRYRAKPERYVKDIDTALRMLGVHIKEETEQDA